MNNLFYDFLYNGIIYIGLRYLYVLFGPAVLRRNAISVTLQVRAITPCGMHLESVQLVFRVFGIGIRLLEPARSNRSGSFNNM